MSYTFMDAHAHLEAIGPSHKEWLYYMNVREMANPVNYTWGATRGSANTYKDAWDANIETLQPALKAALIQGWTMLGVAMVSIPRDPDTLFELMPEYLEKPGVVAIGEIGFQPGVPQSIEEQEYVYKSQLEIGKKMNVPIDVHTPPGTENKRKYTERALKVAQEVGVDLSKLVIDHTDADNIEMVLEAGAKVGISVQRWRNVSPAEAARLVMKYESKSKGIWINSDFGGDFYDLFALPGTALELKKAGASDEVIQDVCGNNARRFYGLM